MMKDIEKYLCDLPDNNVVYYQAGHYYVEDAMYCDHNLKRWKSKKYMKMSEHEFFDPSIGFDYLQAKTYYVMYNNKATCKIRREDFTVNVSYKAHESCVEIDKFIFDRIEKLLLF